MVLILPALQVCDEVERFYFNNQNLFFTLEERGKAFDAR